MIQQYVITALVALLTAAFYLQPEAPAAPTGQIQVPDTPEPLNEVKVFPISHATAVLDWGGTIIYIKPEKMTLIVVGDKEKIESQIEQTLEKPLKQ